MTTTNILLIGTLDHPLARQQADGVRQALDRLGVLSAVEICPAPQQALLHGAVHLLVQPLPDVPVERPDEVVVTAVSARPFPNDLLLVHPETVARSQDFCLKTGAMIGGATPIRRAQMLDFRPDVQFAKIGDAFPDQLEALRQRDCDALLIAEAIAVASNVDLSGFETVALNPRECIPAPGQGTLAYLALRDDHPTRRILKALHHPDVSACTNVERRLLQGLGGTDVVGAYAERDTAGNFHLFAAGVVSGVLRRARLSQSTSFDLAERMVTLLQK